jgi:cysteine desulfurase
MLPWLSSRFGNASSRDHAWGWDAAAAVDEARDRVADLIGASPTEIIFTSSATESVNLALQGIARRAKGRTAVISATEHESVLATCRLIELNSEVQMEWLQPDQAGRIDPQDLFLLITKSRPALVSQMLANNEIGNIHSFFGLAELARSEGAVLFADVTQAVGKIPVDMRTLGLDLAAFSAHKIYGPKGIGALYVRDGVPDLRLEPLVVGGGQERGLRAGTLNVPGIVGFGEACRIAKLEMANDAQRIGRSRDKLERVLIAELPDIWINGDLENRLPNTTNIGFRGVDARALIRDMHDIAVSTKSACSSGTSGPSHVLKAIGLTDNEAYSCIRFSLGRFTTEQEIDYTIEKVVTSVRKLRSNLST